MKMTFVTSDGVEQVADVRVWDMAEAEEHYPTNQTKRGLYMGWSALCRDGIETREFVAWAQSITKVPDVDLEGEGETDPKESSTV